MVLNFTFFQGDVTSIASTTSFAEESQYVVSDNWTYLDTCLTVEMLISYHINWSVIGLILFYSINWISNGLVQ